MSRESVFLLLVATGLTPIALSYGLLPQVSLSFLFDVDASSTNLIHTFRAIMGLYLGLVVFWMAGARKESLRLAALWSLAIFMSGLAAGRIVSLVFDGMPHPLLVFFLVLELGIGFFGFYLIRQYRAS
jgi:hypothetical protein